MSRLFHQLWQLSKFKFNTDNFNNVKCMFLAYTADEKVNSSLWYYSLLIALVLLYWLLWQPLQREYWITSKFTYELWHKQCPLNLFQCSVMCDGENFLCVPKVSMLFSRLSVLSCDFFLLEIIQQWVTLHPIKMKKCSNYNSQNIMCRNSATLANMASVSISLLWLYHSLFSVQCNNPIQNILRYKSLTAEEQIEVVKFNIC